MRQIKKGSADQSVVVRIIDATDGTPETGVVYNTSGIDLWYRREGATKTSITEASLSALSDAHADGGVLHIGDGYYRLDLPDAAVATGANGVMVGGTVTGMVVVGCYVQLVDFDPYDSVRLGLTALPNAAADAAGGLPISDAGGLDLDAKVGALTFTVAGKVDANTLLIEGSDATNQIRDAIVDDATRIDASALNTASGTSIPAILDDTGTSGVMLSTAAMALFFIADTGADYGDAVAGSVVKEIADNAGGSTLTASAIADEVETRTIAGVTLVGTTTNLTNAPTAGDFTATMKTSIGTAVAASAVASVTGAVGSVTGNVGGNVVGSVASVTAGVTLADDAITAAKFDESTAFPLKSADTGSTAVARTGADADTLETLSDQMDTLATATNLATAKTAIDGIKSVTDLLPDAGALTSLATAANLATVDATVDAIRDVTDLLPDAGALTSLASAANLATVDTVVDAIQAVTDLLPDSGALSSLASAADLSTVDTVVDAIKAVTDKLDTALESDGLTGYQYTTLALENGPSGSGASAADIADAVWDEILSGHAVSGSTGEALGAAGGAGDPWITALPGSYTSGQAGYILGTYLAAAPPTAGAIADAVWDEATTGHQTAGTAGLRQHNLPTVAAGSSNGLVICGINASASFNGLTTNITGNLSGSVGSVTGAVGSVTGNVGGNVTGSVGSLATQAKADVNAEVDTALADYDGPTNAEMEARTILAALYGTAANQVTIASYIDTEIAALTTAVADIPTNDELSTALGTADDAVLAAIAALNNLSSAGVTSAVTTALTTALTEAYRSSGATGSVSQLLYEIAAHLGRSAIVGTTKTIYRLDGTTTAKQFTLDDATTPTAIEEA